MSRASRHVGGVPITGENLLLHKVFTTDAGEAYGTPITNMTDGSLSTRWISNVKSPAYAYANIGAVYTLTQIKIAWVGDCTKNYNLQISSDASNWTTIYTGQTDGVTSPLIVPITNFSATPTGQFIRVNMLDMHDPSFGNSIWEIEAYGTYVSPGGGGGGGGTAGIFTGHTNVKVMFVGDSITFGTGNQITGGWRLPLLNQMYNKGWSFIPVGFSDQPPTKAESGDPYAGSRHSSYPGWRMDDVLSVTQNNLGSAQGGGTTINDWMTTYQPDVVTILLGRNDFAYGESLSQMYAEMQQVLDVIYNICPTAHVFIGTVLYQQTYPGDPYVTDFNNFIVAEAARRKAAGKSIFVVATAQAVTQAGDYSDSIHPNYSGYVKMAAAWLDAFAQADASV